MTRRLILTVLLLLATCRGAAAQVAFLQDATDTTDTTVYTFAAQNLGAAAADRHIIVTLGARKTGATTTLTSVVIGGVTATLSVTKVTNATNTSVTAIAIAAVPTGTTGDVVVTFPATMTRCAIGVFRVTSLVSATVSDSTNSGAGDPSSTLNIPANGFAIGAGITAASTTATWTNLTETSDFVAESVATMTWATANFATVQTALTITIDFAGSPVESAGAFASWGLTSTGTGGRNLTLLGVGQ